MPHVHFTFPPDLKQKLERAVPLRERSQFVAKATEAALQMKRLRKTLLSKKYIGTYSLFPKPNALVQKIRRRGRKILASV